MGDKVISKQEKGQKPQEVFAEQVGTKETRKLRARGTENQAVWFWFGTFGMVGWSVVIPTLVGVAVGMWIDMTWPSRFSWTLMLLMVGVILGCFNAWYWVSRESRHD